MRARGRERGGGRGVLRVWMMYVDEHGIRHDGGMGGGRNGGARALRFARNSNRFGGALSLRRCVFRLLSSQMKQQAPLHQRLASRAVKRV